MPNPIPGLSAAIDDARASDAPAAGHNLPPADQLQAELYLAQVRADSALNSTMRQLDDALRGESGFQRALEASSLFPTIDFMVVWEASKNNAAEKAIIQTHNSCGVTVTPAYERELKIARSVAVHASTSDIVTTARIGDPGSRGTADKPLFKYVVQQDFKGDAAPGDEPWRKDMSTAKAELDKRVAAASGPAASEVWGWAKNAHNNVNGLRFLAAKVASVGVNSGRWRNLLFMGIGQDLFKAYKGIKPLGQIWLPALAAAREAQVKYVKAVPLDKRNPTELSELMRAGINSVLDLHRTAKARDVDSDAAKLVESFERIAGLVEKEFSAPGLWIDIRKLAVMTNVPLTKRENAALAAQAEEAAAKAKRDADAADLKAQQDREEEDARIAKKAERDAKAAAAAKAKADGDASAPVASEPKLSRLLLKNKPAPTPAA